MWITKEKTAVNRLHNGLFALNTHPPMIANREGKVNVAEGFRGKGIRRRKIKGRCSLLRKPESTQKVHLAVGMLKWGYTQI